MWVCETCGVEHAEADGVCAICADERQWVPAGGQQWATLEELAQAGRRVHVAELEPDLVRDHGRAEGRDRPADASRAHARGNLLWDPVGYLDDEAVERVRELGEVTAIAASHPHMFGVQVEWSPALGGVPVLVSKADVEWVQRPDAAIRTWSGRRDRARAHAPSGRRPFPRQLGRPLGGGRGRQGRAARLGHDPRQPRRATVTFLRSYPNRIPLSPAVVERLTRAVSSYRSTVCTTTSAGRSTPTRPRPCAGRPIATPVGEGRVRSAHLKPPPTASTLVVARFRPRRARSISLGQQRRPPSTSRSVGLIRPIPSSPKREPARDRHRDRSDRPPARPPSVECSHGRRPAVAAA